MKGQSMLLILLSLVGTFAHFPGWREGGCFDGSATAMIEICANSRLAMESKCTDYCGSKVGAGCCRLEPTGFKASNDCARCYSVIGGKQSGGSGSSSMSPGKPTAGPCAVNNGGCAPNGSCMNDEGSATCGCFDGFRCNNGQCNKCLPLVDTCAKSDKETLKAKCECGGDVCAAGMYCYTATRASAKAKKMDCTDKPQCKRGSDVPVTAECICSPGVTCQVGKLCKSGGGCKDAPKSEKPRGENLALGGSVTANSAGFNSKPGMLINGKHNNGKFNGNAPVCVATVGENSWIQLDLGDVYDIDDLVFYGRDTCGGNAECIRQSSHWTIYISETSGTTSEGDVCARDFSASGGQAVTLNCGMTGRYVVIRSDGSITACELEVYGTGPVDGGSSGPVCKRVFIGSYNAQNPTKSQPCCYEANNGGNPGTKLDIAYLDACVKQNPKYHSPFNDHYDISKSGNNIVIHKYDPPNNQGWGENISIECCADVGPSVPQCKVKAVATETCMCKKNQCEAGQICQGDGKCVAPKPAGKKYELIDRIPYIDGQPICGHFFWNDNIGAKGFCEKIGIPNADPVLELTAEVYDQDAYIVGVCATPDQFPDQCSHPFQAYSCAKGQGCGFRLDCAPQAPSVGPPIDCSGITANVYHLGKLKGANIKAIPDKTNTKCIVADLDGGYWRGCAVEPNTCEHDNCWYAMAQWDYTDPSDWVGDATIYIDTLNGCPVSGGSAPSVGPPIDCSGLTADLWHNQPHKIKGSNIKAIPDKTNTKCIIGNTEGGWWRGCAVDPNTCDNDCGIANAAWDHTDLDVWIADGGFYLKNVNGCPLGGGSAPTVGDYVCKQTEKKCAYKPKATERRTGKMKGTLDECKKECDDDQKCAAFSMVKKDCIMCTAYPTDVWKGAMVCEKPKKVDIEGYIRHDCHYVPNKYYSIKGVGKTYTYQNSAAECKPICDGDVKCLGFVDRHLEKVCAWKANESSLKSMPNGECTQDYYQKEAPEYPECGDGVLTEDCWCVDEDNICKAGQTCESDWTCKDGLVPERDLDFVCVEGLGQLNGARAFYDENDRSKCEQHCIDTPWCVGFDHKPNSKQNTCRLYKVNAPRKQSSKYTWCGPGVVEYDVEDDGKLCGAGLMITDVDTCKSAAKFLEKKFGKVVTTKNQVPGCRIGGNGQIYFNSNLAEACDTACQPGVKAVCIVGEAEELPECTSEPSTEICMCADENCNVGQACIDGVCTDSETAVDPDGYTCVHNVAGKMPGVELHLQITNLDKCVAECNKKPWCLGFDFNADGGHKACMLYKKQAPEHTKAGDYQFCKKNVAAPEYPECGDGVLTEDCWCVDEDNLCKAGQTCESDWTCKDADVPERDLDFVCVEGLGQLNGARAFYNENDRSKCEQHCVDTPWCVGFDHKPNSKKNTCRLYKVNAPRIQSSKYTWCGPGKVEFDVEDAGKLCGNGLMITDVDTCKSAAKFLEKKFGKVVTTKNQVPGCRIGGNGQIYFNSNLAEACDTACQPGVKSVCYIGEAIETPECPAEAATEVCMCGEENCDVGQTCVDGVCEDAGPEYPECGDGVLPEDCWCVEEGNICTAGQTCESDWTCKDAECVPYSQEACKAAALSLGLKIGGAGKSFLGNYKTKGCYAYSKEHEKYRGMAYYGTGGTEAEMKDELTLPRYRPENYDCSETVPTLPECIDGAAAEDCMCMGANTCTAGQTCSHDGTCHDPEPSETDDYEVVDDDSKLCEPGLALSSEALCKAAADSLGLPWGKKISKAKQTPDCRLGLDGKVYFNKHPKACKDNCQKGVKAVCKKAGEPVDIEGYIRHDCYYVPGRSYKVKGGTGKEYIYKDSPAECKALCDADPKCVGFVDRPKESLCAWKDTEATLRPKEGECTQIYHQKVAPTCSEEPATQLCMCEQLKCTVGQLCVDGVCKDAPKLPKCGKVAATEDCACGTHTCTSGQSCVSGKCEDAAPEVTTDEYEVLQDDSELCPAGLALKSEKSCKAAAKTLGLPWAQAVSKAKQNPDCRLAKNGKVYFNKHAKACKNNCQNGVKAVCKVGEAPPTAPPCEEGNMIIESDCMCGDAICPAGQVCGGEGTEKVCEEVDECGQDVLQIIEETCFCGGDPCSPGSFCYSDDCKPAPDPCAHEGPITESTCMCGGDVCAAGSFCYGGSCHPDPAPELTWTCVPGQGKVGKAFEFFDVSEQGYCQGHCADRKSCLGYDFKKGSGTKSCRLYNALPATLGSSSGYQYCAKPPPTCPDGYHEEGTLSTDNTAGLALKTYLGSMDECAQKCEDNVKCNSFSFGGDTKDHDRMNICRLSDGLKPTPLDKPMDNLRLCVKDLEACDDPALLLFPCTCGEEACPAGHVCHGGVCKELPTCPPSVVLGEDCTCGDEICPEGSQCENGECTELPTCDAVTNIIATECVCNGAKCTVGNVCVGGKCTPPPACDVGPKLLADCQCGAHICNPDEYCFADSCHANPPTCEGTGEIMDMCLCGLETCDVGQYCYEEECHDEPMACEESDTLANSQKCMCAGAECPAGNYCYDGGCHVNPKPPVCEREGNVMKVTKLCTCVSDGGDVENECSAGKYCLADGSCSNTPPVCKIDEINPISFECMCNGSICGWGKFCYDGQCMEEPKPQHPPCVEEIQIDETCMCGDKVCDPRYFCYDGKCNKNPKPCHPTTFETSPIIQMCMCGRRKCDTGKYCVDGKCQNGPKLEVCPNSGVVALADHSFGKCSCMGEECADGKYCYNGKCHDGPLICDENAWEPVEEECLCLGDPDTVCTGYCFDGLCEDEPRVPCTSGLVVQSNWPKNYKAEGQYFSFDNAAGTEFFGTGGYSSQVYPVRNSRGYRGEIKVYKSSKNCGNCGRWETYGKSDAGDWLPGDIICHNDDDLDHQTPAEHPLELCATSLQVTNGHPGKYRPKGMYFGFDNACMDLWYGSSDWHFKTIEVKAPDGKVGQVQFYKDNENCKMSCGRWVPEELASGGDWSINDLLVMANPPPHHTPEMCKTQLQITKEVSGGSRACVDNDCVEMFFGLSSSAKWPSSAIIETMDGTVGKIALFKDSSKCGCSCIRWSPSSKAKDDDWTFRELLYHGELDCADSTSPIKRKCKCAGESCAAGKYCHEDKCVDEVVLECKDSPNPIAKTCTCMGETCAAGKYCHEGECVDEVVLHEECEDSILPIEVECLCAGSPCEIGKFCHDGECVEEMERPCLETAKPSEGNYISVNPFPDDKEAPGFHFEMDRTDAENYFDAQPKKWKYGNKHYTVITSCGYTEEVIVFRKSSSCATRSDNPDCGKLANNPNAGDWSKVTWIALTSKYDGAEASVGVIKMFKQPDSMLLIIGLVAAFASAGFYYGINSTSKKAKYSTLLDGPKDEEHEVYEMTPTNRYQTLDLE